MNALHRAFTASVVVVVTLISAFVSGCDGRASQRGASDLTHVDRDVRSLVDRWSRAFQSRDLDSVRSVLGVDDRFVWLEDGEPRYRSADEIVRTLAGMPAGLAFTHSLGDIRIVPISNDVAWAHLTMSTKIKHSDQVVSEFASVVLMVVQRDEAGWRIAGAHSSTSKPRSPKPG